MFRHHVNWWEEGKWHLSASKLSWLTVNLIIPGVLLGGEDQFVPEMNFSHKFNLDSACGVLPYTNYTAGFKGHLDYVYYDKDSLEVTQVIPLPDDKDLEFHTAIPSLVFPSDHIAQICDLKWKNVWHWIPQCHTHVSNLWNAGNVQWSVNLLNEKHVQWNPL